MFTLVELLSLALLFLILVGLAFLLDHVRKTTPSPDGDSVDEDYGFAVTNTGTRTGPRRRRAALARARRLAAAEGLSTESESESEEEDESVYYDYTGVGEPSASGQRRQSKKDANREAKREAQASRAAAVEAAHERAAAEEEARAAEDAAEEEVARLAEEEARKKREEREKKEQEEYESWKDLISVEDAGEATREDLSADPDRLTKFCNYIRDGKVIVLEELGAEFDMPTEEVVDRLTRLEETGMISGFFDDRGKFIYVSREEMEEVAKFIRRKGRVSIQEIATESTRLLHLDAVASN